jgi:3-dehydroquinate synthase
VAIGTALAFRLSVKLGLCPREDAERFILHLKAAGLPSAIADIPGPRPDSQNLIAAMAHDKKVANGKINFVLLRGMGKAFVTSDVPASALADVLAA